MFIGEKFSVMDIVLKYGIKNFLTFQCRLPYQLLTNIDVFDINTNMQLSENIKSKNRKIIYAVTDEFIKNQSISSKGSFVECNSFPNNYSFFITNIDIIIEIDETENKCIDSLFKTQHNSEMTTIFQSVLEIFASKYNEAMAGKDIFNPIASECGANICGHYIRNKLNGEYDNKNFIISTGFGNGIPMEGEQENLREIINEPYKTWKYFYNKSKYSFSKYKNLDCVLYGAISLESYLNYLIQINELEEKFNIIKCEKEKDGRAIGFFATTRFLKDENVISEEIELILNSVYGKISQYRNDIVHGKINTPLLSREIALKTKNGLEKLYNKVKTNNVSKKIPDSFEVITMKLAKEKKYFEENNKFENIEIINNMINNNQYNEYCLLLRGKYYMITKDFEKALLDYSECVKSEYNLKVVLHNRANAYIELEQYDKAIEDMEKLEKLLDGEKLECIHINKGIALYYKQDYEKSIQEMDIAITLYDSTIAYYYKALNLRKLHKVKDSIKQINIVIDREPKVENYITKVDILIENEDVTTAEQTLNEMVLNDSIIEYNNIIANLYNAIGIYFYNKIKDYKHSIELFSKAIEFNKNQKEYFKNRSKAYEIIGDNINASKDMLSFKQL